MILRAQILSFNRYFTRRNESPSIKYVTAILVPKPSPDGKSKFRFCVDFRALNSVKKFDSYPLPYSKKPQQNFSAPNNSHYFTATADSGNLAFRKNTANVLHSSPVWAL